MRKTPIEDRFTDRELTIMLATIRRAVETVHQAESRGNAVAELEDDEWNVVKAMIKLGLEPDEVKELDLDAVWDQLYTQRLAP